MRIVGQLVMYLVYIQYIAVHEAYQSSDWPKDPRLQSPCESESRLQRIMATTTTTTSVLKISIFKNVLDKIMCLNLNLLMLNIHHGPYSSNIWGRCFNGVFQITTLFAI